uniref:Uncharacterized protein n=1 Tax=Anguilla anguilla TaxID=7936 RepID=A0A0E9UKP6_ANGAN
MGPAITYVTAYVLMVIINGALMPLLSLSSCYCFSIIK